MLFDFDDTLFDHSLTCRAALGRLRASTPFLRRLPLDTVWREYSRLLEEVHPDVLAGLRSIDEARTERFRRLGFLAGVSIGVEEASELSHRYRSHYQRLRRPVPGVPQLLRRLHARAVLGIVTNNERAEQEEKLTALGLSPWIDALVVSQDVGVSKPDPRIFAIALDRVGASPSEAVMIGDSWESDVRGAQAAGIRAIWFNRFGKTRPDRLEVDELRSFRAPSQIERILSASR